MKQEQLAIINNVGFGNRDVGHPVLFFTTMTTESSGALQVLVGEEAMDLIQAYGTWDIKEMEGKPIWVTCDGNIMKVARAWNKA